MTEKWKDSVVLFRVHGYDAELAQKILRKFNEDKTKMNFLEALKTGKPLRSVVRDSGFIQPNTILGIAWTVEELLGDWEIQEPTVTITRSQLIEAMRETSGSNPWEHRDLVAKKLGL